jgi:hypothetical protein
MAVGKMRVDEVDANAGLVGRLLACMVSGKVGHVLAIS